MLHDLLESRSVSVWFSEKDVGLGEPLLRAIDKGLAKLRVRIVPVTPALLRRLQGEGIAEKGQERSPLLGSRSGLGTGEEPMADVTAKIAELVALKASICRGGEACLLYQRVLWAALAAQG